MTRVYQRRFRVRGYEVGATGRVHDSVVLNYVQQAALEASADAGYDTRRYDALGTIWVIRKQTIAFLRPLLYDDVIELTTWVSDFRRVRSHREYELRSVADDLAMALVRADWVYIDAKTLYPRRIPAQMRAGFEPIGPCALNTAPALEAAQVVVGRAFEYQHSVKDYELDHLRHVNNANYLNWLSQARIVALAQAGFPMNASSSKLEGLDLSPCPVRYEIEYFVPAVGTDQARVLSRVVAVGRTQMTWFHQILRGEERLVKARATLRFETDDGESVSLPETLLVALARESQITS